MLATLGDLDQNLAKFSMGDRQIPIRVQLDPGNPQRSRHYPESARRDVVRRVGAAEDRSPTSPSAPVRRRSTASTAAARSQSRATLIAGAEIGPALATRSMRTAGAAEPPARGASVEIRQCRADGRAAKGFRHRADAASLLLIFAVLVLLFGNFFQPPTIMMALPLSVGGALVALLLANQGAVHAGDDRTADADGHRHQEFDPAGRICHRRHARQGDEPDGGAARCGRASAPGRSS